VFTTDLHNNLGRWCSINDGARAGQVWMVYRAVKGARYMVRHTETGEYRTVSHRVMSNLY
jgi:hypothetical protein